MFISPAPPFWLEYVEPALHIPDGFLNIMISLIFWVITIAILAIAIRQSQSELGERQIPLMGIMAAFIFAGQMINFPVAGGTSGHLLGGVLAAIVLGPWAGMVVMASVIGLQALLFQDGGLVVMGANIFDMGLLTAFIGFGLYRSVVGQGRGVRLAVAGMAAWLSVMTAAFVTAIQLWLSGTSPLEIVMPAMLGVHVFIGLGEALITVAALAFIMQTRPDLLEAEAIRARGGYGWVVSGLIIILAVLLFSPLASGDPDGLERVATDLGFIERSANASYQILPGYTIPLLGDSGLSTVAAGAVGALVVAFLAVGLGRALKRSRADSSSTMPASGAK